MESASPSLIGFFMAHGGSEPERSEDGRRQSAIPHTAALSGALGAGT